MADSDLNPTQLRELCHALGWQGGTYWQVLAEVRRLAAAQRARPLADDAPLETSEADARPWSPAS